MDPIGTISEGEWSCLSGMYTTLEADFMAQLLGNCPMIGPTDSSSNNGASSGFYWPSKDPERGIELGPNGCPFNDPHEMAGGELVHFMVTTDRGPMSMEFCVGDASNNVSYLVEGDESSSQENVEETKGNSNGGNATPPRNPKKRRRSTSLGDNARSDERNRRGSKKQKLESGSSNTNEEENNAGRPASSSCCSEEARRGAATDPQSLYARKRRERINERLKILQSLVPNGTKVDISTMLEEAVQYVKFLQLQIKLLSSDEMWMYAPIAYNGMDIGLNLR